MSSVAAIIFSLDRKSVYLMKRRDVPVWVLPGGGIEKGESPEEAAIREVEEELGFTTVIKRKVAFYQAKGKFIRPTHFYECTVIKQGTPSPLETIEVRLFPLDKLPPLIPVYKEWIDDAALESKDVLIKEPKSLNFFVACKLVLQHPILFFRFICARLGKPLNTKIK